MRMSSCRHDRSTSYVSASSIRKMARVLLLLVSRKKSEYDDRVDVEDEYEAKESGEDDSDSDGDDLEYEVSSWGKSTAMVPP